MGNKKSQTLLEGNFYICKTTLKSKLTVCSEDVHIPLPSDSSFRVHDPLIPILEELLHIGFGVPKTIPRFDDLLGGFRIQCIVLLRYFIAKGYTAKSAKGKVTWVKETRCKLPGVLPWCSHTECA